MPESEPGSWPALVWALPHGVRVAWSTAADGDQRDPAQRRAFARVHIGDRPLVVPRQVHGTLVVTHDAADLSQADGVVSRDRAIALGAYGADCPGLVIATPDVVGIAHCGWRGTAGGIVVQLCTAIEAISAHPRGEWHAFIGPGISGPQYEVDGPVLSARAWPVTALSPSALTGRAHLDLVTAIAADLQAAGVMAVGRSGVCTASDPRLHSFRHQGAGLVQALIVWREPGPGPGPRPSFEL